MSQTARYLIVQHVADLFRREANNIGIFVRTGDTIRARFFGEDDDGKIDNRKTGRLPFPDVYRQWVEYWHRTIIRRDTDAAWQEILKTGRDHYQILDGGTVDAPESGSMNDLVRFLYTALVSEGGIAEAIGAPDGGAANVRLTEAVGNTFRNLHLLEAGKDLFLSTRHPVIRDMPVKGKYAKHLVSFFQRNGHPIVMEPVDLTVKRDKKRTVEHAGWASRVFEDVKAEDKQTETIAIVNVIPEESRDDSTEYALSLIKPFASIVNWFSDADRAKFLEDRKKTAAAE